MVKVFQLIFKDKDINLHTKIKVTAPLLNESMTEFIIKAIKERIEKVEKERSNQSNKE